MNKVIQEARRRGVLIIHAPSTTVDFYKDTSQRKRAQQARFDKTPMPLATVERWGTAAFDGVPLIVGLLLVLAGGIAVARTRAVSVLTAGMTEGAPAA